MTDRSLKRSRRESTEDSDSEGTDDWSPQNSGLNAARRPPSLRGDAPSSRSRRGVASRTDNSSKRSIRLTVKQPPSRLRQVMDAEPTGRESLSRASRNKRAIYQEPSEDEDEEEEEDLEEEEQEVEEEDEEEDGEEEAEDDEESGSAQEDDEDEDEEMPDAPRQSIKLNAPNGNEREQSKLARQGKLKSVEEKEIQMAGSGIDNSEDDDEELSELDSQQEELEEQEEDEEGSDEQEEEEDEDDDGGEGLQNDALDTIRASAIGEDELSDDSISSSRAGTPDPTKLTRRQRGTDDDALMALSNEAQKKKVFTAQEITMRRAEMARRRKDLSEKRNEEEKADTLNRLLHKQAPKRRTRAQILADAEREEFGTPGFEEGAAPRAKAIFVRTRIRVDGTRVGVPLEWLEAPIGAVFEGAAPETKGLQVHGGSRMVQVIE